MEQDKTYNGWTNYATWRVMLEIFDGYADDQDAGRVVTADECESYVSEILDVSSTDVGSGFDLVRSYADAFLGEVNWYEIANHITGDIEEA
jgi:hypothetical protein